MSENLLFQYCQKLVVLSADKTAVLLAKRKGEVDYDGVYSFIGGKMETTDKTLLDGMQREKNEEIGEQARIRVLGNISYNVLFRKKDSSTMVLPHIAAQYIGGSITLNEEYSDYKWVPINELAAFSPKIENTYDLTLWAAKQIRAANEADFTQI